MKHKSLFPLLVVSCFLAISAFDYASAENMNIDIGNQYGTPSSSFGAASGQSGVWNTIGLGVTPNLLDINSASTSVGATVTADSPTGNSPNCAGDFLALLGDNIYTLQGTWTVVLNGLGDGNYTVYLYGPENLSVASGNMLVNGVAVASITGDSCAFQDGLNYTTVQTNVTSGTMTISGDYAGTGIDYAGLAGIQLVQQQQKSVPTMTEWGMIIFVVLAGLGSVYYIRRRKRAES